MKARFVAMDCRKVPLRRTVWVGVIAAVLVWVLAGAGQAMAATATLSGDVTDGLGTPLAGSTIAIDTVGTTHQVASTVTALDGSYSVSVEAGSYDVHIAPPAGDEYHTATFKNYSISGQSTLDVVLVSQTNIVLSGVVRDGSGVPLSGIRVAGCQPGVGCFAVADTGADGSFSLLVPAGNYNVQLKNAGDQSPPSEWTLTVPIGQLSGETSVNLELPVYTLTAHVIDEQGNPVSGVSVGEDQSAVSLEVMP